MPTASSSADAGEILSEVATRGGAGGISTVTAAAADNSPDIAVIAAMPVPTAVTSPVASTVATSGASEDQVIVAPVIALPSRSLTSAVNWMVAPSASSCAESGEITSDVATGEGGSGGGSVEDAPGGSPGSDEPPEHAKSKAIGSAARPRRRIRTRTVLDANGNQSHSLMRQV